MDGLSKKIETKVTGSMQIMCDNKMKSMKRDIESEVKRAKKSIEEKDKSVQKEMQRNIRRIEETIIPTVEEHIGDEIDDLTKRVSALENKKESTFSTVSCETENHKESEDRSIIVKHLTEGRNESTLESVDRLIKNGLRLSNIKIESAERWDNRDGNTGAVLVKLQNMEQKKAVMSKKKTLKFSGRYEKVYIEPVLSVQQRIVNANFRRIIKNLGENQLYMTGSRIFNSEDYENNRSSRNEYTNDRYHGHEKHRDITHYDRRPSNGPHYRNDKYQDNRNNSRYYERDSYNSRRDSYSQGRSSSQYERDNYNNRH